MANEQQNLNEVNHEPLPLRVYLGVFGALLVLTFITVWIAQFDFGIWTLPIAMLVAASKASLVVLYFMNLKYDSRFNAFIFSVGLFFLFVFVGPTLWDRETRLHLGEERGEVVEVTRPGYPPGVSEPLPEANELAEE